MVAALKYERDDFCDSSIRIWTALNGLTVGQIRETDGDVGRSLEVPAPRVDFGQ